MLRTYWREACRRRRREARAGPDRRRAQSPGKGERPYLGRVGRTVNPLWAGTVGGLGHIGDQAIKPRPAIRPLALVRPCNKPGHTAPEVHRTSPSPARAPAAAAPVIYLVILLFLIHILSSEMVRRPASRRSSSTFWTGLSVAAMLGPSGRLRQRSTRSSESPLARGHAGR